MKFLPFMLAALALLWAWDVARWVFIVLVIFVAILAAYHFYQRVIENKGQDARNFAERQRIENVRNYLAITEQDVKDSALRCIEAHKATLARKRRQLVCKDDYGRDIFEKWMIERDHFIANVLAQEVPKLFDFTETEWLKAAVEKAADDDAASHDVPSDIDISVMSPVDFEHFCADLLRESGWDAVVTRMSGDQGVDIVASMNGIRAVFQCKLYSSSVGNSAVQEIFAGKKHERADIACVVTNSTFTASARQLAATTEVLLLHFSELPQLARASGFSQGPKRT